MGNRIRFAVAVGVLGGVSAGASANGRIITGTDSGVAGHVKVFDGTTGTMLSSFLPYGAGFTGGVRVAAGDVNGDGSPDVITGAGVGGGGHVRIFDGTTGAVLRSFFAYGAGFTGGVFVASGDVDGDGMSDIVTGADSGGGPHVKVFSGQTGAEIRSFFAYSPSFTGGVRVASGDLNGDGFHDLYTGTGSGIVSNANVFDGVTGNGTRSFQPYGTSFSGGVFVGSGDVNGDGLDDIVTGADAGAGPLVKVFNATTNAEIHSFFAFTPSFAGGVRVAAGDLNGDGRADIVTGTGAGDGILSVFDGLSGAQGLTFAPYDGFTGGIFVAASPVPEPTSLAAFALGGAWLLRRRRGRKQI